MKLLFIIFYSLNSVYAATSYDAVLEPQTRKLISTQTDGILHKCLSLGTRFKVGDIILSQDVDLLRAEAEQRKLEITALNSELKYYSGLVENRVQQRKNGIISKEQHESTLHEFTKVKNKVASFNLELKKIEIRINSSIVRSDINGIISKEYKHKGEFSRIGESCVEVIDDSVLYAILPFPALKLPSLENAIIKISVNDKQYDAKIVLINPEVDGASGLIQIKIAMKNSDLKVRPGQKCKVIIN